MSGARSATDLAAAKMGDLLLKGYRMLDATCSYCHTVLMQDRNGKNTCVLCGSEEAQLRNMQQQTQQQQQQQQQHSVNAIDSIDSMDEDLMEVKGQLSSASNTKIQAAINDIVSEVKSTAEDLSFLRETDIDFTKRERILKHIKRCAEVIKDLKSLQN